MPRRRELVGEQLEELLQDLKDLKVAVLADPKKQARKERLWALLLAAMGTVATIAARRVAAKAWSVLTGEQPPTARPAPSHGSRPPARPPEPQRETTEVTS
jgi:hypothetical protein